MLALVMAAAWADYLLGVYGWCLIKNYNVTIAQLANPLNPYSGAWPPGPIGPNRVFPGQGAAGSSSAPSAAAEKSASKTGINRINAATHGRF
jgi:hypothetical protein